MKNLLIISFLLIIVVANAPEKKVKKLVMDPLDLFGICFEAKKSFLNQDPDFKSYIKVIKGSNDYVIAKHFYKQGRYVFDSLKKINKKELFKKKKIDCDIND